MPLFMDIHTVDSENFSVEDVARAHMEDLSVQAKFGVIQIKYWVNVESKLIFCLMEGPDKEACNLVHKESHGGTACNIIEVSDHDFNLYLGIGSKNNNDLAQTMTGEIDIGYRSIMTVMLKDLTGKYDSYTHQIQRLIEQHKGVMIILPNKEIMASFIFASNAIICGLAIMHLLQSIRGNYEHKLAIVTGFPVDENGSDLFEETKKRVQFLCKIGSNNFIYLDETTLDLSNRELNAPLIDEKDFKVINEIDFSFLNSLFQFVNEQLYKTSLNNEKFHTFLGMSKSQAYRKIKALTGMASNQFFQELKLDQSLEDIKKNSKTIAQIAYDLGFNSPSYFTRVFRKRFGLLPTDFAKNIMN